MADYISNKTSKRGVVLLVLFLILAFMIVFALLNALTNIVLLPWFINLFNISNKKQGVPFGLKQEDNTNV